MPVSRIFAAQITSAIAAGPRAWCSISELAARLPRRHTDAVRRAVAELVAAGALEYWDLPAGQAVTLTPHTAAAKRAVVVEVGHQDTPRWADADDAEEYTHQSRGEMPRWLLELAPDPVDPPAELYSSEPARLGPVILWGVVAQPLRRRGRSA
jgi:hypothetical protein